MHVDLDPQLAALIHEKVESGSYTDASAVVREALRLLEEHDQRRTLGAELQVGFEQIEQGELVDFTPELLDRLARESEENARNGKPVKDAVRP
jgi:antitoxin ParD1/3/4